MVGEARSLGPMDYRTLGRTGLKVSPFCLGAMMFGAWGNPDHEESVRIIHRALDAGINFIDTADVYSRGRVRGDRGQGPGRPARRRRPGHQVPRRHGRRPQPPGQLPAVDLCGRARTACAAWEPTGSTCTRSTGPTRSATSTRRSGALTDLVHAGKVRYLGSSTFPAHAIVEAQWVAGTRGRERFVCEQPPYSILVRGIEADVLPVCQKRRHGRHPLEPAGGRLAVGQVPQGARRSPRAGGPAASRGATTCPCRGTSASWTWSSSWPGWPRRPGISLVAPGPGLRPRAPGGDRRPSSGPAPWSTSRTSWRRPT